MVETAAQLRISLADIALLTQVQRPVVSMWRSRSKGTAHPFPEPIAKSGAQELFDAGRIVDWLELTGRGNNPNAAEDLAAFAAPTGANPGPQRFNALTALLTLRSLTGSPLGQLDADDLLDAADEQDPDDAFLYTELGSLNGELGPLAKYTDLLVDAAYSAPAAFERLMADRFRAGLRRESRTALTEAAIGLVAATAVELAAEAPEPIFADATQGSSDLLMGIAGLLGEDRSAVLAVGNNDDGAGRLARRRLRIHGVHRENLRIMDAVVPSAGSHTIWTAQFPSPAQPELSPKDLLTAVDDIVLRMDDAQRAVIIGPAAVLADAAASRALDDIRSDVLRSGRVRAIVKLPQGLVKSKPRQAQALWVLGPAHLDVPIGERWTMTADLSGTELDAATVQDLVSDLAAAMGNHEFVRAHAFRFARLVLTRVLLASRGSLTQPPGTQRSATTTGPANAAADLVRAEQLIATLNTSGGAVLTASAGNVPPNTSACALWPLEIEVQAVAGQVGGQASAVPAPTTIGKLLKSRSLVYLPGTRVDEMDIEHGSVRSGGVGAPVFGTPELHGHTATRERRIDRLLLAAKYPHAQLTEPGDIVFCTGATPAAEVDEEGSAVVTYPARVLRINARNAPDLLPELLAADINSAPAGGWRSWPARTVPA
ncbi:hypothetical protein D477_002451, partial [Arthrobacter crystallopoietes BAB-32]